MKTVVILFCLAGFVASAIILDRPRLNVNIVEGSQNAGIGRLYTMTRVELLRQKFILDILKQVELPLQNRDFLQVGLDGITDENLYIGPLDDDMLLVLDLIRNNRILGKSDICSLSNEQNLRQLIGLYRLFVRSRDFESFQRLVIYSRKTVNPVLFVNALTLALADRDDTRILIVPALYEILPRSYNEDSLIRAVENAGVNVVQRNIGSIRPSILDIIELGRNTRLLKSRSLENGYPGGIIDRSQLWKPWRDMRRQLALQNSLGGSVFVYDQGKQDVSVSLISGGGSDNDKQLGLISEDVGLRAFLNILLDKLIIEQGNIQNSGNIDQSLPTTQIRDNIGSGIRDVGINIETDAELGKNVDQEQNIDILGQLNQHSLLNDRNVQRNGVEDIDTRGQGSLANLIKSGGILAQNSLNHWRKAINIRGQDYLNRKSNIPLDRDNIESKQSGILDGSLPDTNAEEIGKDLNERRLSSTNLDQNNIFADIKRGSTDESDWLNAQLPNGVVNNRQRLDDDLPTTSINSDRLLHVGGRRLRLLQGKQQNLYTDDILGQRERSQTPVAGIEDGNNLLDADRPQLQRGFINNRQTLDDGLPTTSINSDRLLHVGGRRLRLLQGKPQNIFTNAIGQRERSQIEEGNNLLDADRPQLQRGFINKDLPTTSINSDRLLHVSGRRLRLLEGKEQTRYTDDILGQREISQTLLSGIEEGNNYLDSVHPPLQRVPRSLQRITNDDRRRAHIVQLILYQLQQLVARLNIEQIALQNGQDNLRLSVDNDIRIDDRFKGIIGEKLNEITERLDQSLQQAIAHLSNKQSYYNQINADDDQSILQQLEQITLNAILQEVVNLSEYVQGGRISNVLENHTTQLLLRHVINTVEQQIQKLKKQRNVEEISFNSVNINNLKVDGLRTFLEDVDIDLSNLQGAQQDNKKIIIGRVPRLNHKSFTINLDLTSDRNQRVIVRTLLGPKINVVSLQQQQRQNFVLLDIASLDLKVGRNAIKRKSRDITWTGRDVTSYSEIYERVLRALRGDVDLTSDVIFGQTTLFPDRLLLPRGRVDGLPMQILVIITPASAENLESFRQPVGGTRLGLDSLILDNLPIRYPLDRDITNVGKLLALPNVFSMDVLIYHDEKIKRLPQ